MLDFQKEAESLKKKGLNDENVIKALIKHKEKTPYMQKKRIPTEMYDKVNLMCRNYMDRMARFEVDYDFVIDIEKFKATVICCLECAPFMHSRVINSPIAPYWKVADYHIDDMVKVSFPDDIDKAREEFFKNSIPLLSNVQMHMGVFIHNKKTYICFYWNHMCFDGGGFKAFWTDICKNYTEYVENNTPPVNFSSGSRKYSDVYKDMTKEKLKRAKKQLANISPKAKRTLPFTNEKTNEVIISSREISAEKFKQALAYAKSVGATATDILLAAYITALGKVSGLTPQNDISVACAVDLRRHMKDLSQIGYTNHVSFIHCTLDEKGVDFKETLSLVAKKTKELKDDEFIGLHGLPLLNFAYSSMTYIQAEILVKMFYNNPILSVSNVGAIDKDAFSMAHNKPFSAFVAGAAKNKPCAVMTCLTIDGTLKTSICLRGTEEDKKVLETFFTEFKNTIEEI